MDRYFISDRQYEVGEKVVAGATRDTFIRCCTTVERAMEVSKEDDSVLPRYLVCIRRYNWKYMWEVIGIEALSNEVLNG